MSARPDAGYLPSEDPSHIVLAANRKARQIINDGFHDHRPRWGRIPDGGDWGAPRYRSLELGRGPAIAAMTWALHNAGLTTVIWCDSCQELHRVTDDDAAKFKFIATCGAVGTLPEHGTPQ